DPAGHHAMTGSLRPAVARETALVLALLAAGVALGGLWAELAPVVARRGDPGEARIAVDGTLALLLPGAGLVTALLVALRRAPRRRPAQRGAAAAGGPAGLAHPRSLPTGGRGGGREAERGGDGHGGAEERAVDVRQQGLEHLRRVEPERLRRLQPERQAAVTG